MFLLYINVPVLPKLTNNINNKILAVNDKTTVTIVQGGQKTWKNLEFDNLGKKNLEFERF